MVLQVVRSTLVRLIPCPLTDWFNFGFIKKEIPFHSCPLAPSLPQTRTSGSDCRKHHTVRAFYVQSQDHTRRGYVRMYLLIKIYLSSIGTFDLWRS